MPMRNPGEFLLPAVQSVLSQDGVQVELIVIDDGSTDGSRERLQALADPRVVLLDGPRSGISNCLNVGLERVTGVYVARCDADDLYQPGRLRTQIEWLQRHPGHVAVCGAFSMVAPGGEEVGQPFRDFTDEYLDGAQRILDGRLRTHLCAFALRTEVLARTGGFRPYFETAEDIDFVLRLAEQGPIGFMPENAYRYRLHGASVTHTQASERRRFFESTAYGMSAERQATGSDALMRGQPPTPPAAEGGRPDSAPSHVAQLLVGESWNAFARGDRPSARRHAWRAIRASPHHRDAWKALLLVSFKPLRGA